MRKEVLCSIRINGMTKIKDMVSQRFFDEIEATKWATLIFNKTFS